MGPQDLADTGLLRLLRDLAQHSARLARRGGGAGDMSANTAPIGIFDSGLGGLTVVRALRERLPHERLIYFGDTARVPYGIKSPETVTRFAAEDCNFLMRFDPKLIVVACNTASAAALPALNDWLSIPVVGVVKPGAAAAVNSAHAHARRTGRLPAVLVLGTEGTVRSNAYQSAIQGLDPAIQVIQRACPLLVPCVEEGRSGDDAVVRMVLQDYLAPARADAGDVGVAVMGCTHYPLIREAIAAACGPGVDLVCSAEQTAEAVAQELERRGLPCPAGVHRGPDRLQCIVSDNPERFAYVGSRFLGAPTGAVQWVSPEEFMLASAPSAAGA